MIHRLLTAFGKKRNTQTGRQRRLRRTRLGLETLESRQLLSAASWDGGGDGTTWTDARNWASDTLPTVNDDVTIAVAANPTIRLTSGARSIRSLVCNEALNITGGSLRVATTARLDNSLTIGNAALLGGTWDVSAGVQVTGSATLDAVTVNGDVTVQERRSLTARNGTALNGALGLSANSSLIAGAGETLTVSAGTALSDVNVTARDGAVVTFPSITALSNVNLTASAGGRIIFPDATSYTGGNRGDTTIQANGQGSKIDLSHLQTLAGGGCNYPFYYATHIKALAGGEVDLAGVIGENPAGGKLNNIVLSGTGSVLGVDGVTELSHSTLSVTGATASFPAVSSLSSVSLLANTDGQIQFPVATDYTGDNHQDTIIQANGRGSKIDLSHLQTLAGGGCNYPFYYATHIKVVTSGEVDLAGSIGENPAGGKLNNIVLSGTGSALGVDKVTELKHSTLSVTGATVSFPAVTSLSSVSLLANTDGRILFPTATDYTGDNHQDTTIQANGWGSKIDLSHLQTLAGGGCNYPFYYTTHIKALAGGEVDLAGAIGRNPAGAKPNDIALDGVHSRFDLSGVVGIGHSTLVAANGATWVLPAGWRPQLGPGNTLTTRGLESGFVNQANLTVSGVALVVNTSAFINQGTLNALAGGVLDFNGSFRVDDPGILAGVPLGRIAVSGDLLGDTRNAAEFAPLGDVRFDGAGTAANPQRWEAMSRDLGPYEQGFVQNFAFGTVTLAGRTYVQLVNRSLNTAGGEAEAVYVDTLVVPARTTLDLNGLHLYARTMQIAGTVLNGTVQQVVPNHAPTVQIAASAMPSPVTDTTTGLSVLGADVETGESSLTYTWTTTELPDGAAAPAFSSNGSNAAKITTATFHKAGTYSFTVTIADPSGLTATGNIEVTVHQSLTSIVVNPSSVALDAGATQQLTATANDQFGDALDTQPAFTWTTTIGTITPTGMLTAPASASTGTVTASSGEATGTVLLDNFDSYSLNAWPPNWAGDGNSSTDRTNNRVVADPANPSNHVLKLYGVVGGSWGANAYRQYAFPESFTLETAIYNGAEPLSGGHPYRGCLELRQGTFWWNAERHLLIFDNYNNVTDANGRILQSYGTNRWYDVKIGYDRVGTDLSLHYWIDGVDRGVTRLTISDLAREQSFDHVNLTANEGTAYFDNLRVTPASEGLGVAGTASVTVVAPEHASTSPTADAADRTADSTVCDQPAQIVSGAGDTVALETDPSQVAEWLDSVRAEMLDADGNGAADVLTDGLLIRRSLSGSTGQDLVRGAVARDATRREPAAIEAFLASFVSGVDWDDADFSALVLGRASSGPRLLRS